MGRRALARWRSILLVAALVALTAYSVVHVMQGPPHFTSLSLRDVVLDAPVTVHGTSGRRSLRSPYAMLKLQGRRATIENLCFVWQCELSPAVAALDGGDRLRVWMADDEIWQLEHDGELLLDYQQAVDAHRHSAARQERVYGGLACAIVAMLAWLAWRARKAAGAGNAQRSRDGAAASGSFGSSLSFFNAGNNVAPLRKTQERSADAQALVAPTLRRFREAAKRHDRDAMIAALVQAGVSEGAARQVVEGLLADPARVGS